MTVRTRRKKNKLRGQRTHAKGNTKNKRGSGVKGGVGRAGSHKHKFSKYYDAFGKKGKLKTKTNAKALNVGQLQQKLAEWEAKKLVGKEESLTVVDAKKVGFQKILGTGAIKDAVLLKNFKASKRAAKKISEAGGRIEGVEALEEEDEEFEAEETEGDTGETENKK